MQAFPNENSTNFTPMSNYDLLDAVEKSKITRNPIKHFRGVFMRDQLPANPQIPETGIINLDGNDGPGTHWVCYAIFPRKIIYFDSYGLPPPNEFVNYVGNSRNSKNFPIWYSTLPTQTINDPPICGRETINALKVLSKKFPLPGIVKYTSSKLERR